MSILNNMMNFSQIMVLRVINSSALRLYTKNCNISVKVKS